MSIKFALQRAVLGVLLDTIGLQNMTEEDFAFVEMSGEYGSRRDKDNSDVHQDEATHIMPTAAPFPLPSAPGLDNPPQPDLTPKNTGSVDPAPMLDRGPEPQSVGDTISTEPPAEAGTDGDEPMPDYTTLGAR